MGIVGPANFRKMECTGVLPESPGQFLRTHILQLEIHAGISTNIKFIKYKLTHQSTILERKSLRNDRRTTFATVIELPLFLNRSIETTI